MYLQRDLPAGEPESAKPRIFLGCAGWTIPSRYAADFAGEGSHLERYARRLPAVEINSSFYRPHQRKTYERWRDSVPEDFRFAVKLPKAITHTARLKGTAALLDQFISEAGGLQEKLGALLIQLPPSLAFEATLAREFFALLRERPDGIGSARLVLEARHRSWNTPSVEALLANADVDAVFADPNPLGLGEPRGASGTIYLRLHGSPVMYRSSYSPAYLAALGEQIVQYSAAGKTVWCIFDNTADAAATSNVLDLSLALLALRPSAARP